MRFTLNRLRHRNHMNVNGIPIGYSSTNTMPAGKIWTNPGVNPRVSATT